MKGTIRNINLPGVVKTKKRVFIIGIIVFLNLAILLSIHPHAVTSSKAVTSVGNHISAYSPFRSKTPISEKAGGREESQAAIIFPSYFEHAEDELAYYYKTFLKQEKTNNDLKFIKHSGPSAPIVQDVAPENLSTNQFDVFDFAEGGKKCSPLRKNITVQVSKSQRFDELLPIAHTYIEQRKRDPALAELDGFIKEDIHEQISSNKLNRHWYKLAGSSVWLKEYGVHFMVSRVMYSPQGSKRRSPLSLTYAQIFDEKWNEIHNGELVFPYRGSGSDEEVEYTKMQFPSFLPVPFFHDFKYQGKRFYGAEDPRLLLVKDEDGHDEPLMVYNSHHRKIVDRQLADETHMNVTLDSYRSMFMAWPFRSQKGKDVIMGLEDPRYSDTTYIKAVELRLDTKERIKTQKNWTPFISEVDRNQLYDENIYFVYRWDQLEVLRCPLTKFTKEGMSACRHVYRKEKNPSSQVGPFRGGTQMLSLRSIMPSLKLPKDKEVWIGFARAHLKNCGCGRSMYRPNLAVITRVKGQFHVSHVGGFTSLNVASQGWGIAKYQCGPRDANVLIPNGLSSWIAEKGKEDTLTVTLSVADESVEMVHVKGLLNKLFEETSIIETGQDIPNDNTVLECGVKASNDFCKAYGIAQIDLGTLDPKSPLQPKKPAASRSNDEKEANKSGTKESKKSSWFNLGLL
ncbi:hypothetical protein PGUG_02055 [Meyerozyma guilliermondii ATCC 6260]|uniref:Uncharacterized protein n=1 Tax=Meyerozyma guilliermondii (strain ATCC 6260 / CBS 566 / DSM 6381 / JCM 1539 / NBRC 10279 / NRRL Y-324) TaxID=294746 RepID=A5DFK4_PICGU|nr:uncharacterized protein PGUG_02055 [Meyerozyma guilliermondii ATCC 6260]EDK37957.2 hypothetical protein PGUG_02055 [Meyerozyma guilliermondii ATCC 6260]